MCCQHFIWSHNSAASCQMRRPLSTGMFGSTVRNPKAPVNAADSFILKPRATYQRATHHTSRCRPKHSDNVLFILKGSVSFQMLLFYSKSLCFMLNHSWKKRERRRIWIMPNHPGVAMRSLDATHMPLGTGLSGMDPFRHFILLPLCKHLSDFNKKQKQTHFKNTTTLNPNPME